ncbi:MAG: hypothetical protein J4400_00040 [Candidatus Aenigmarchaeota archaeon]|nr:hypothetical protein [Candidatus Aenigmarchaeota archaeon]
MPDPTNVNVIMQELVRRSNEDSRRLRGLEQRLDAIENRINNFENSSLDRNKKVNLKFAEMDLSIKTLTEELMKVNGGLEKINKQVNKFARKQDLKEIERMLDLISPLKQEFVTKDQLEEELKSAQH